MPSRDPQTGKRIGGTAQRKLAAARRGELVPAEATTLTNVPVPPSSVAGIESWAAVINLRCATETVDDLRLHWIGTLCRELGKMGAKAKRAEKVMRLRRLRQGIDDAIDLDTPPIDDPVAIVPWCYAAIAAYMYAVAADSKWQPDAAKAQRLKLLSQAAFLACEDELSRVVKQVDDEAA